MKASKHFDFPFFDYFVTSIPPLTVHTILWRSEMRVCMCDVQSRVV